jgi:hypothetical protein
MKQLPYISNSNGIIGYSDSTIAKSETNDCFVRAVASSFEIPYDDAHSWVKTKFNRINRKGTKRVSGTMDTLSMSKLSLNSKLFSIIKDLKVYDNEKFKLKRTTLNQFIKKYPTGTFIILVRGHAFTLKDGNVIGNLEDSKRLKKIINYAYQIYTP